ncbi:hypothetical protein OS493_033704 [Desmophyllum pertusum]|uniref:Uncharacterized protein n=1 Tax=Desmophyllum pertusum TaxID=174260 RepID=A0A9X0D1V7_9CNID|nr:hypothetical protein OS493_033704 [Desmophyllum pertusum]
MAKGSRMGEDTLQTGGGAALWSLILDGHLFETELKKAKILSGLASDNATITGGAMKGAIDAVGEIAKQHPTDAAAVGRDIAKSAGIKDEYGLAFASGFLGTAKFE